MRHLLGGGAVVVHVAHEALGEVLAGAGLAIDAPEQGIAGKRGTAARTPRAADAEFGVAVHGAEDGNGVAKTRLDDSHGDADQGFGGGAAALAIHVEIEPHAEVAGDDGRGNGVVAAVGQHAVDVVEGDPGIFDRRADGSGAEGAGGHAGAAGVLRLTDADDGVLAAQIPVGGGVDLAQLHPSQKKRGDHTTAV